jgi:hypothetical protein
MDMRRNPFGAPSPAFGTSPFSSEKKKPTTRRTRWNDLGGKTAPKWLKWRRHNMREAEKWRKYVDSLVGRNVIEEESGLKEKIKNEYANYTFPKRMIEEPHHHHGGGGFGFGAPVHAKQEQEIVYCKEEDELEREFDADAEEHVDNFVGIYDLSGGDGEPLPDWRILTEEDLATLVVLPGERWSADSFVDTNVVPEEGVRKVKEDWLKEGTQEGPAILKTVRKQAARIAFEDVFMDVEEKDHEEKDPKKPFATAPAPFSFGAPHLHPEFVPGASAKTTAPEPPRTVYGSKKRTDAILVHGRHGILITVDFRCHKGV